MSSEEEDDGMTLVIGDYTKKAIHQHHPRPKVRRPKPVHSDLEDPEESDNTREITDYEEKKKFFLENRGEHPQDKSKSIFEFDIDSMETKPWREPTAVLSDYFNYGLDEEKWKIYCEIQLSKIRTSNKEKQIEVKGSDSKEREEDRRPKESRSPRYNERSDRGRRQPRDFDYRPPQFREDYYGYRGPGYVPGPPAGFRGAPMQPPMYYDGGRPMGGMAYPPPPPGGGYAPPPQYPNSGYAPPPRGRRGGRRR